MLFKVSLCHVVSKLSPSYVACRALSELSTGMAKLSLSGWLFSGNYTGKSKLFEFANYIELDLLWKWLACGCIYLQRTIRSQGLYM